MQLQSDLLGVRVVRPNNAEATASGAAYLAGLGVGYWPDQDAIADNWQADRVFEPSLDEAGRSRAKALWRRALERSRSWEAQ
jgi:glycerol kinase